MPAPPPFAIDAAFWKGKNVLLTGHSGFKGSWLTLWLREVGANVFGISLPPDTDPSLFEILELEKSCHSVFADIRDYGRLRGPVAEANPDIILHLAAQPLVQLSYQKPLETFAANIMGTAHLLEAARECKNLRALVVITTDKVYANDESNRPFSENDALGGHDPYSASKAGAEIVAQSYAKSFYHEGTARIATARAGNVIGGGDWSANRLLPDIMRARQAGKRLEVRYPDAVRPWQHVAEPLAGYLMLARALFENGGAYAKGWNFGPDPAQECSVRGVLGMVPGLEWTHVPSPLHEAGLLRLDSAKAAARLGWQGRFTVDNAVARTLAWYEAFYAGQSKAHLARLMLGDMSAA